MKHISLFSGIGGFDLAAEWMGWENVAHCEWNPFGQKILKYYWPNAISYEDITKTDFTIHRGNIDILTGGFPCQPYSVAGKRKGKEDDRHLWPEMLRAIREIQPKWIVGENVRGLVNWDGGMVFEEVQADLESQGYKILPFLLPAAGVNAPHQRERIWFVAYSTGCTAGSSGTGRKIESSRCYFDNEQESRGTEAEFNNGRGELLRDITNPYSVRSKCRSGECDRSNQKKAIGSSVFEQADRSSPQQIATDTKCQGLEGYDERTGCSIDRKNKGTFIRTENQFDVTDPDSRRQPIEEYRKKKPRRTSEESVSNYWENFPTQSPICDGNDGLSSSLDGITFPKWRNESIKAGGNAIVPQVVYQIFKAIEEYEINFKKPRR